MPDFKQFLLPDAGEGTTEAEILSWRVKPGDDVTVNQIIVEIETAKAAVELPSPFGGKVSELLVEVGQTVEVGAPIIEIDVDPTGLMSKAVESENIQRTTTDTADGTDRVPTLVGYGAKVPTAKRRLRKENTVIADAVPTIVESVVPLAKPPVRKLARDLGVDLRSLSGSGTDGVVTRDDVQRAAAPAIPTESSADDMSTRQQRVLIRGVRKATAAAMVESAFTAPHVTEFLAVDVTPMMELRAQLKGTAEFAGVKLTPLAFVAKAMCLAVRRTPEVNATWDEQAGEIIYKSYVHLGIAAATPRGLIVPKIRDADGMSLRELALALDELTATARDGKTSPVDMANGTITITNVGVFGVDTGTPIITPGESAILAFGAIRDMPWVVDGEIVPRKICQLALSFDHRIVDGAQGSRYLADVGALLANPAAAITY